MKKRMRKRMAKLFKKTEKGYHDAMMEGIELLIDTKNSNAFDEGYQSCLSDMAVRAHRLAEYIVEQGMLRGELGKDKDGEPMAYFEYDEDLAQVIEEYFNDALNKK